MYRTRMNTNDGIDGINEVQRKGTGYDSKCQRKDAGEMLAPAVPK